MFIRRPKNDRTLWGTALDVPKIVFYVATTGKPVQGLTIEDVKRYAVDTFNADIAEHKRLGDLRQFRGAALTLDELKRYQPLIDAGNEMEPRNPKELTINRMIRISGARRWVRQLLLLNYDSHDGTRKIPQENYYLAMMFYQRSWDLIYLLVHTFWGSDRDTMFVLGHFFEKNTSLHRQILACGWPVIHTDHVYNHDTIRQAGLDVV